MLRLTNIFDWFHSIAYMYILCHIHTHIYVIQNFTLFIYNPPNFTILNKSEGRKGLVIFLKYAYISN